MIKALVIPALAVFACRVQVEAKLDLFDGDERVGFGTYKDSVDHKGRRTTVFHLWSRADAVTKTSITHTKVIDSQGFPIREEEEQIERTGGTRSECV